MQTTATYDPRKISLLINTTPILGFSETEGFIATTPSDLFTTQTDIQGKFLTPYINAVQKVEVQFVLQILSPSNDFLKGLVLAQMATGVSVVSVYYDNQITGDKYNSISCLIRGLPSVSHNNTNVTKTWNVTMYNPTIV